MRTRVVLVGASIFAAVVFLALPPRAVRVVSAWQPDHTIVAGAFHVHTTRSDGRGSIDDVAAAAARAGLQFVIFTDHGDGTSAPEPPAYRSSVLCVDGVEISTNGGHYATLGMPQAPYPLAGEPRDVVEDVHRLGGFGVAAHGDSEKVELRWSDWDAPIDGLEWLNLDSVWRAANGPAIAKALLGYWLRPPEALASIAARPDGMLRRWDMLSQTRSIGGLAATDAHGQVVPSYETSFRTVSTRVELSQPLTRDASLDARAIVDALRAGRHYTMLDALASPGQLAFSSRSGMLDARVAAPSGARLVIFRNGSVWRDTRADHLREAAGPEPAVYRAEVWLPTTPGDRPLPWIVSNPIAVGPRPVPPTAAASPVIDSVQLATGTAAADWAIEHDPSSSATITRNLTAGLNLQFALGGVKPFAQFVAMVRPVHDEIRTYDRIVLRARADRPMRVALQMRARGSDNPARWQRSVYLDTTPREVMVRFSEFKPVVGLNASASGPLPVASIGALMFVVDTNNTRPGTGSSIAFSEVAYAR